MFNTIKGIAFATYKEWSVYRSHMPDKEFNKTKEKLITLLEVEELIKKPARQLSLGQRMKCEFIMAMLHSPV